MRKNRIASFEELRAGALRFFDHLASQMTAQGLSLPEHWNIDHICYRVETFERYLQWKQVLSNGAHRLIESDIGGRPIATFRLDHALEFQGRRIDVIELPAPKAGQTVKEGFEHIEVVIDCTFAELEQSFPQATFKKSSKEFNREWVWSFQDCAIKFHHLSLESVVTLEGHQKVFGALEESCILSALRDCDPQVVGTWPLDLATENSDVDVLLFSTDLPQLAQTLESLFQSHQGFEIQWGETCGEPYVVARFACGGVSFELFGQAQPTPQQRAFRHFLVEERLLKLGGRPFREQLKELRRHGCKTEPAFAQALGLSGDPYLALLELQRESECQLLKRLRSRALI